MAVLHPIGIQLLDASQTRAILPHLDQLVVCLFIMHVCLGCFSALGSNVRAGSLGQFHDCFLLRGSLERCINGPCGSQVCFAVRLLIAAFASAVSNTVLCPHLILELPMHDFPEEVHNSW